MHGSLIGLCAVLLFGLKAAAVLAWRQADHSNKYFAKRTGGGGARTAMRLHKKGNGGILEPFEF